MRHATCMQGNQGDSWHLVVESQIHNSTPDPSFGHNLCFKYPNGSCKPIVDIYVPRAFQWYKEIFNPMCFDPCNCSLKIWESIKTPTPKVGVHLGVWGFILSHYPTLLRTWYVSLVFHSWPAPSQAFALVASPRLGLQHIIYESLNLFFFFSRDKVLNFFKDLIGIFKRVQIWHLMHIILSFVM
jgi:hypothetical protein